MTEPGIIKKLDETVVNRIAAGEIIQRPANALKELLENSLDAKATNISVTLKNGGLKLLQIQDNGCGIRKEDLPILCERFTTSKLREYEDLSSISTYGFRGEALASISHISHLTVLTKTAAERMAWKATYKDGKLENSVCQAGNQGTVIYVEDLFYNVATRRRAFQSFTEEFTKVAEVVGRYAIHNPHVGFSLKKAESTLSEIKTPAASTCVDNIRIIFGNNIARELLEVSADDETLQYKMRGYVSNVNYSLKKSTFILFINHRLVDSTALRKSIENVYSLYLPKGMHPFLYLSIELDPKNVDVNVHPTKHEVHFLHEDLIIEKTQKVIEEKLLGSNKSRVFYTQTKLPDNDLINITAAALENKIDKEKKGPELFKTRVDSREQKLDKFLEDSGPSKPKDVPNPQPQRREIKLTSVLNMKSKIESECNIAVRDIISNISLVGCVDPNTILVQHESNLYLFRYRVLVEEMFYQLMVCNFGNLGAIKFKANLPLYELAMLGLEDPETNWKEEDGKKELIAESVAELLSSKAEMLSDYFSIQIDHDKNLRTLPLIIENYLPDISRLPHYILRLACDVDWNNEQLCFETFCRETARFYSHIDTINSRGGHDWKWVIEHDVLPALKKFLLPPRRYVEDGTMLLLTSLPDLYKVFERC